MGEAMCKATYNKRLLFSRESVMMTQTILWPGLCRAARFALGRWSWVADFAWGCGLATPRDPEATSTS